MANSIKVDWNAVEKGLAANLKDALGHLVASVDGKNPNQDLLGFFDRIAVLGVAAAQSNDSYAIQRVEHQIQGLGEVARLRAVNVEWHVISGIAGSLIGVVVSTVRAVAVAAVVGEMGADV